MRKFVALTAKVAISLALLYFAVGRVNLSTLSARLEQIQPGWMLTAVALLAIQTFLVALRWRAILGRCGVTIPARRVFRFTLIGGFFNQTLPSTVGGDAARIWLAARDGAGWARATYSVLVDRVIGVLALAVIVVACMPKSFELIRDPVGRAALVVIGLGCIAGPAVFVALGTRRLTILDRFQVTRHLVEAAALAKDVCTSLRVGAWVGALSLAVHGMTVLAAWMAAKSVAAPFDLMHSLLVLPPVLLIATIPVSIAGWGVRESAMVLAFAYAGLPESDGLLVSVLYGAALFAMGAIGGLVWLFSPGALRAVPAEADAQTR